MTVVGNGYEDENRDMLVGRKTKDDDFSDCTIHNTLYALGYVDINVY